MLAAAAACPDDTSHWGECFFMGANLLGNATLASAAACCAACEATSGCNKYSFCPAVDG